jgi:NAD(P)-dependent dehydrogenase (short-subunit alcohol dehydrogenase family)
MSTHEGQIALVTGANKGIGREIARGLARRGMIVLLGARDAARGRRAETELRAEGDVRFLQLDVTDEASVEAAARRIEEEHERLDVLVNNAGISVRPYIPPSQTPLEHVRRTYETNVFGVVAVTHAMLPLLRRSPAARIVNLTSNLGSLADMADPEERRSLPGLLAYNSSKSAVNAITLLYANELRGTGILVNAANPGYCSTDLNEHEGILSAEQGATVPVHLATLRDDGPTGAFVSENGTPAGEPHPW